MELLLLGALAYAGTLNSKRSETQETYTPTFDEDVTIDQVNQDMQQAVVNHLQQEYTVTPTNQVPFFRSERSQNTNDAVKDRRLATFTGVDMLEFNHKHEVESQPPSRDLTNVYGSTYSPDIERYQTYVANTTHNNTSAITPQLVGPGLGLKEGEAAEGGFHQFYRIKPGNVNGYRKHNHTGRVVHGKRGIDNRTEEMSPLDGSPTAFMEPPMTFRGLDYKQSTVSAQAINSPSVLGCTNRNTPSSFSDGVSTGATATYNTARPTRDGTSMFPTNTYGNPHGQTIGGYGNQTYTMHSTERETSNDQLVNVSRSEGGTYTRPDVDSRTMREQSTDAVGNATPVSFSAPSVDRSGYEAKPTLRYFPTDSYQGNANESNGSGGYVHSSDGLRPTLRDGEDRVLHGPANGGAYGYTPYTNTYTGSQCVDKKEHTLVQHAPNANTHNMLADPTSFNAQYRDDRQPSTYNQPSVVYDPNRSDRIQSSTKTGAKSDMMNTRDFGFAKSLLKDNPFAIDITA
jgi:hypothetical protein